MGISMFNPSLGPKVYRRYTAWQIDAGGRPIRQLLLHEDEPHNQDDTPDDLVLVSIPPRFADPIWNRQANVWHEGSLSAWIWRFCRLLIPMLLALLLAATLAKAQEPYRMPFPIWEHLRAQVGTGGVSGVPANAVLLQGRFLSSTAPTANQVIKWNAGTSQWEPGAGGGGASAWSDLTNPTANLSLSHGAFTTTFTYGAATGAGIDLWSVTDTLNNTGTGFFQNFNRASGSAISGPFRYRDNNVAKFLINGAGRARASGEISVYETADVADETNFSMFDIFSTGTTFDLQAHNAGTGVLRPIRLGFLTGAGAFAEKARLSTSGGLSVGAGGIDPGAGVFNVDTGYRLGNAAASGNYLRGNGTNFVGATILDGDLPVTLTSHTLNGTTVLSERVDLSGDISPAALAGDQNDWNPTGLATASTIRVDPGAAARNITGLAGGADGRIIIIHNIGAQNIVLMNQSASSLAANRFALSTNWSLAGNDSITLRYDFTSSRWRAGITDAGVVRLFQKRHTSILPTGEGPNGTTIKGDTLSTTSGTSSRILPDATDGVSINWASAATINSDGGVSGEANYRVGRNSSLQFRASQKETTVVRFWLGFTSNIMANVMTTDTPSWNVAGFHYCNDGAGTACAADLTNWEACTSDGTTMSCTDTGVVADGTARDFKITDNGPSWEFCIGATCLTRSTNLPAAGNNLRILGAVRTLEAVAKNFRFYGIDLLVDK